MKATSYTENEFRGALESLDFAEGIFALVRKYPSVAREPGGLGGSIAAIMLHNDPTGAGLAPSFMEAWRDTLEDVAKVLETSASITSDLIDLDQEVRTQAYAKHSPVDPLVKGYIDSCIKRREILSRVTREEIARHGITQAAKDAIDSRMHGFDIELAREKGLDEEDALYYANTNQAEAERVNR